MAIGQELLAVPFPEMILNMGLAIARAQQELDLVSLRIAQFMAGKDIEVEVPDPSDPTKTKKEIQSTKVDWPDGEGGVTKLSLLELGFTPTFYQFVDTIIEVKISIAIKSESSSEYNYSRSSGGFSGTFLGFYNRGSYEASSVSASFASKYQYSAEGSSLLRTKLVPVPPPAILQERIRKLLNTPTT